MRNYKCTLPGLSKLFFLANFRQGSHDLVSAISLEFQTPPNPNTLTDFRLALGSTVYTA